MGSISGTAMGIDFRVRLWGSISGYGYEDRFQGTAVRIDFRVRLWG